MGKIRASQVPLDPDNLIVDGNVISQKHRTGVSFKLWIYYIEGRV